MRALILDCFVYSTFFRWIHDLVENLYKMVSGNFVSFHSLSEKIEKKLFALFFVCFLFQSPRKRFIIQKLSSKKKKIKIKKITSWRRFGHPAVNWFYVYKLVSSSYIAFLTRSLPGATFYTWSWNKFSIKLCTCDSL